MSHSADCFVCCKHRNETDSLDGPVFEDSLVYVGHAAIGQDGALPLLGHYLVEPKRHVKGFAELNELEAQAIGLQLARTSRAVQTISGAEHIYLFVLGHHVDHLHIHVVPRYPGTPREYWGMRADEWPGAPHGNRQDIADFNKKVRALLVTEEGF